MKNLLLVFAVVALLSSSAGSAFAWPFRHPTGFTVEVPDGFETFSDGTHLRLREPRHETFGVIYLLLPGVRTADEVPVALTAWMNTTSRLFGEFQLGEGGWRTVGSIPDMPVHFAKMELRVSFDQFSTVTASLGVRLVDEGALVALLYYGPRASLVMARADVVKSVGWTPDVKLPAGERWGPGDFSFALPPGAVVRTRAETPGLFEVQQSAGANLQMLFVFGVPDGARTRAALVATANALSPDRLTGISVLAGPAETASENEPLLLPANGRARVDSSGSLLKAVVRLGFVGSGGQTFAVLGVADARQRTEASANGLGIVDELLRSAKRR